MAKIMKVKTLFVIGLILSLIFSSLVITCSAQNDYLVEQYAPILYFEKEETCFPVEVDYFIDNSVLYDSENNNIGSVTGEDLVMYTTKGYYLDNQKGTVCDDGVIEDYQSMENALGYTVYTHVDTSSDSIVIQYWFFYVFNKGTMNIHEGDWEMVQVVISGETPSEVMYSQHHGGQKALWDQVERDGDHIKVYVSRGSHANYLRSYSGKFGIANDIVAADGKVLDPTDYTLELIETQGWLYYAGLWGEYAGPEAALRGQVGPSGPMYRESGEMWSDPLGWGASLSQADNLMFMFEWFLYNFVMIFVIISLILVGYFILRIYKKHQREGLGSRIISILYIDGLNLKSVGNILCILGIILAIFGLIYPWYGVSADIVVENFSSGGEVEIIKIDGIDGVQINLLDPNNGPVQMGSLDIPFSYFIGISLIFLILATVGVSSSKKLGKKYIGKGIRLIVPIIAITIGIIALGSIDISASTVGESSGAEIANILSTISSSPFGGEHVVIIQDGETANFQWGFCYGGLMLIASCVVIVIAGILQLMARTTFFEKKLIDKPQKKSEKKPSDIYETEDKK